MLVLSVGLEVSEETAELAQKIGVDLNTYNFGSTHPFQFVDTSRDGVYACGVFQGPKDIPGSVVEASAAACKAQVGLCEARGTDIKTLELPEELDFTHEEPPEVKRSKEGVIIKFKDHVLGRQLQVNADLLALSAGMVAEDTEELAITLKPTRNQEGYFLEAHAKLFS